MEPDLWKTTKTLRSALNDPKGLLDGFDSSKKAHQKSWFGLSQAERHALLGRRQAGKLRLALHALAVEWAQHGRFAEALELFDELTGHPADIAFYNNILWAIQHDNSGLGVQPERARRWLALALPHGKDNPAIFFNAACVYFELEQLDETFVMIERAKEAGYDLARIRREPLFRDLRGDPRWEPLFAHLEPEAHTLEQALLDPTKVRKLELGDDNRKSLPEAVRELTELEYLEIDLPYLTELPLWLTQLSKLRKLTLDGCYSLKKIPDEVLAMPALESVSWLGCPLPKRQRIARIDPLLKGFRRQNIPYPQRLLQLALLWGDGKKAGKLGTLADLVDALDSPSAPVARAALELLGTTLGPLPSLPRGSEILLLGKLLAPREVLVERLEALGITVGRAPSARTRGAVVGLQPKGKAAAVVEAGLPLFVENQLRAWLDQEVPQPLAASADADALAARLSELLRSRDGAANRLALEMMKKGGITNGLLEELFLLAQHSDVEKSVRAAAKRAFEQAAPPAARRAVDTVFARTSVYASGETKLKSRLERLAKASDQAMDPVKLATLMLPKGRAFLFSRSQSDPDCARRGPSARSARETRSTSRTASCLRCRHSSPSLPTFARSISAATTSVGFLPPSSR